MHRSNWLYRPLKSSNDLDLGDEEKHEIGDVAGRSYSFLQSSLDRLNGLTLCLLVLGCFAVGLLIGGIGGMNIGRNSYDDLVPSEEVSGSSTAATQLNTMVQAFSDLKATHAREKYNLTDNGLFQESLGSRLLLLNVDNRPSQFSHGHPQHAYEWGRSNIVLYAQLHGYDYKFVQAPLIEGEGPTWVKVKELFRQTMSGDHDMVIMIDSDVIFPDLLLPLEPILNHWNVTNEIALTGALDIPKKKNHFDAHGNVLLNTGFLVAQKTATFPKLMRDWINCPSDVKYKGCSHWKENWAHEQSALSEYIRYDYSDVIRQVPALDVHTPQGRFTQHYWGPEKGKLDRAVSDTFRDLVLPTLAEVLASSNDRFYEHVRNEADYEYLMQEEVTI